MILVRISINSSLDVERSPNEVIQYTNIGPALTGYLVEAVSGVSFEQYIDENIF